MKLRKGIIGTIIILCLALSACGSSSYQGIKTNDPLRATIEPHIREEIANLKTLYSLDDLSYEMVISQKESDKWATGEIVFISDAIADLEPENQYDLMRKIASKFYGDLGTLMHIDDYFFQVKHGDGYSVWETKSGDSFVAGNFNLTKNGQEIFDNPDNDLEQQLEEDLGIPYDEWLEQKKDSASKFSIVDPKAENDDFWFAVTAAQKIVKDELKSPSTAKFPISESEYIAQRDGNDWIVSGYVDAQNGFGAMVRTNWIATFTMGDTSGSTYKVSNYDVTFS